MQWWHEAPGTEWGLILTHGAGSNGDAPLLKAIAEEFSKSGICVLRYDLPYREARRHGPPFPAQATRDREGIRRAAAEMRARGVSVIAGGHSYGGRQTTMAASEDPAMAEALLLLSYPLHPPRKPDQKRTAHFASLRTPAFFAHGSRDPFGSLDEMRSAIAVIPARTELMALEGAPHGLSPRSAADIAPKFRQFLAL